MENSLAVGLVYLPALLAQGESTGFRVAVLVRLTLTVWILVKTLRVATRDNVSKPCLYGLAAAVAGVLVFEVLQLLPLPEADVPRALLLLVTTALILGGLLLTLGLAGYGLVTYRRPREQPYAQGAAQGVLALLIVIAGFGAAGYNLTRFSAAREAAIAEAETSAAADDALAPGIDAAELPSDARRAGPVETPPALPGPSVIQNPTPEQRRQLEQLEALGLVEMKQVPAETSPPAAAIPAAATASESTAAQRSAEIHRQSMDEARASIERSRARMRETRETRAARAGGATGPLADSSTTAPRTDADYPPPAGRVSPVREMAMLKKLAAAIERYRADHVGLAPGNLDALLRDGRLKPADLFTPAAPRQLPADFAQRNRIQQGWYVRRFGGVAYLNPIGRDATAPDTVVAIGRTGLGAVDATERSGAVLWGDGRVSFENNWDRVDALLEQQTRKTTRELIADPMPNFQR